MPPTKNENIEQLTNAGASTTTMPTTDIEDMGSSAATAGGAAAGGRSILGARARVTKRVGSGKNTLGFSDGAGKENASHGVTGDGGGIVEEEAGGGGEEVEEVAVIIRREDDFQGWLAQQKAGWRKHREQSRHKKHSESRSEVTWCRLFLRARASFGRFLWPIFCKLCVFRWVLMEGGVTVEAVGRGGGGSRPL